jgi:hypothetical protein
MACSRVNFTFTYIIITLKRYSPLWPLTSNKTFLQSRRSLATACLFLFPLYESPLQPRLSTFYVVFLFPLFLPLQLSQFVSLFFVFHFFNMTIQSQSEGFYNFTMSYPCNMPSCSCLFSFSSVFLLLRVHIFPLLSSYIVFLGARIHSIQKRLRERRVGKDMERTCCGLF